MAAFEKISYQEALRAILAEVRPLETQSESLASAMGRALAEDLVAERELPGFDNSAMDGFAVRANDTQGATEQRPVRLRLVGTVAAGDVVLPSIGENEAAAIATGAPIPPGADAVVRVEEAEREGGVVLLRSQVLRGRDVRRAGEDVQKGMVLLKQGADLGAAQIALLAAEGRTSVQVRARPGVAILTSGEELAAVGQEPRAGQIFDANGPGLAAQVAEAGGRPRRLSAVGDDSEAVRTAVARALDCDVLVTAGGVSVGQRDFVREVLVEVGTMRSWRVETRPVRPMGFGRIGQTLMFALPGNPVAAMVGFELFVRPAIRAMAGHALTVRPEVTATLEEPVENPGGMLTFMRAVVTLGERPTVRAAGGQGTANLATLAAANCLAIIPAGTERLAAGRKVRVRLLSGNA